jgi:RNA-directed DNA polymerase
VIRVHKNYAQRSAVATPTTNDIRRSLNIPRRSPFGGVVSPVLLNVALHGMETAAGVRYLSNGFIRVDSPALIRYADDFVVHCHSRQDALDIKARLSAWLTPRGLAFNEEKTRVVTLNEGFESR